MREIPYLIFSLRHLYYAIDARIVWENLWLPELTPVAEAPGHIAGVLNLRGDIVPVINLSIRLGHTQQKYKITDSIIIFKFDDITIGIIVDEIHDVCNISPQDIQDTPSYGHEKEVRFVTTMAKVNEDIIMLLDHEKLVTYSDANEEFIPREISDISTASATKSDYLFDPQATTDERKIYQQRAKALSLTSEDYDNAGLIPIAVIRLNNEFFGVDIFLVREFCDLQEITPIPCCPDHILGNINLRGEILTFIDIRTALKMAASKEKNCKKGFVVTNNELIVGVVVDDICDVIYISPKKITAVPSAIQLEDKKYLKGSIYYKENMLTLLDLQNILIDGSVVVNEQV